MIMQILLNKSEVFDKHVNFTQLYLGGWQMKMYYEKDVDTGVLADKTIAVIGYGSQGMAQSRNMADSGLKVVVGLREGGESWKAAVADGMNVMSVEDAAKAADIIHILIPDEIQGAVYDKSIKPYLEEGNTLSFSHGYNIHYGYIKVPEGVNVTMSAPKGPGAMVRRTYLEGFGIPGLVAVEIDATGDAKQQALAMGKGCGLARAGFTVACLACCGVPSLITLYRYSLLWTSCSF